MGRAEVLRSFIEMLEREVSFRFNLDDFKSRLMLQKYVFIAKRFGLDLGYDYSLYIRGPYSRDLAYDYYHLPDESEELPKSFKFEEFLSLVEGKDSEWLEVAATILMIWEHTKDLGWAIKRTNELKEWVPREKVEEVANTLVEFGLIKKASRSRMPISSSS